MHGQYSLWGLTVGLRIKWVHVPQRFSMWTRLLEMGKSDARFGGRGQPHSQVPPAPPGEQQAPYTPMGRGPFFGNGVGAATASAWERGHPRQWPDHCIPPVTRGVARTPAHGLTDYLPPLRPLPNGGGKGGNGGKWKKMGGNGGKRGEMGGKWGEMGESGRKWGRTGENGGKRGEMGGCKGNRGE